MSKGEREDSAAPDAGPDAFVDPGPDASEDPASRWNHGQARGTHNSTHIALEFPVHPSHRYTQAPLGVQLEEQGVRQFELDVHRHVDGHFEVFHLPIIDPSKTGAPAHGLFLTGVNQYTVVEGLAFDGAAKGVVEGSEELQGHDRVEGRRGDRYYTAKRHVDFSGCDWGRRRSRSPQ